MKTILAMGAAVALFGLCACGDDEPTAPATTTQETTPPAETAEVEEVEPSEEELPIPEDFADQAEQEVTRDNYASELDRLEQEINGELEGG